ncbi:MAG TPA: aminoglycoside phosphotransferase family protein [Caulobacteraceae bacterium]|jgi:aminoglycoside phosphotransferase (APT) family kinase protein|nr:aminoglycoside phosphotransferase family protein [Caulobacteraceae bacterium]
MRDEYARRLADLHSGFAAPAERIADAARVLTSEPILAKARIVHGEANEVYRLAFARHPEVILRIARRAKGLFEKEAWAIGRCAELGVPVPEVLSLQTIETDAEPLEFCFLEKLPGERLSDSLSLPRETLRAVVRELGENISRMHGIGPGDLGEGERFFANDSDDFLATEAEFIALGAAAGLDAGTLRRAFRGFEAAMIPPPPRRLTHNDFRACHVLVHEGRLSGLIDFGQVSMDTPINEFAKWDFWESPELPVAWLREGYTDRSLFDERYDALFPWFRLANGLWVLRWYARTGYAAGVRRAATRVAEYLADLGPG